MPKTEPSDHPQGPYPFDAEAELDRLATATHSLVTSAERLTDEFITSPSLVPGWTRGHVLTHVARNADSLINLLTWARTGVVTPAYPSQEARDAAIERGARRPRTELAADVRDSAARFAEAAATLPADRWAYEIQWRHGPPRPASRILWARLREVEVHHVDLGLDYTPAHWSQEFTTHALSEAAKLFSERDVGPLWLVATDTGRRWAIGTPGADAPKVEGSQPALLAWVTGRSSGDGLSVEPHVLPLPELPPWL